MLRLAVIGATGLVGRTVLKVLEEKNLPIDEYYFFSSSKSSGSIINFMKKDYIVQELTEDSFKNTFYNYSIFCAGGIVSKNFIPIAVSTGSIVIDNSSAFRMDNNVPLVVPEVNSEDIKLNKGIIANPNCSTIQAMLPIKALDEKYMVKRIIYSTYQAVSGAGRSGIIDLKNGLNNIPPKKFKYPIYNNCLPHIDDFLEDGYTKEEEKMINETKKILHNSSLRITATCVRVPVFNCHCESVNLELAKSFNISDIINTLKNFPNIVVFDEIYNYPIPTLVCGSNSVFIGRIRRDFSVKNGLNLWIVADNVRKGAATNAVQILEKIISDFN